MRRMAIVAVVSGLVVVFATFRGGPGGQVLAQDEGGVAGEDVCCFPDGTCIPEPPEGCDQQESVWSQAGCTGLCGQPGALGACVPPVNACSVWHSGCDDTFPNNWYPGLTCYEIADLIGACCLASGSCERMMEDECVAMSGMWRGATTTCADFTNNGVPDVCESIGVPCIPDCPADLTNDGIVDVRDLIFVVLQWGPCE